MKNKRLLVVAAHPDDEILGCGATLIKYKKQGYKVKIVFLSDGETSRNLEGFKSEKKIQMREKQANKVSSSCNFDKPEFLRMPDNRLDSIPLLKIVQLIEKKIKLFKPTLIFTHFENDLNIDHQIAYKAVITAARPKSKCFVKNILCFETPSSTEFAITRNNKKIFNPNFYVDVRKTFKKKMQVLKYYKSEIKKKPHARSFDGIKNLSKYRGNQVGIELAEAFLIVRILN